MQERILYDILFAGEQLQTWQRYKTIYGVFSVVSIEVMSSLKNLNKTATAVRMNRYTGRAVDGIGNDAL